MQFALKSLKDASLVSPYDALLVSKRDTIIYLTGRDNFSKIERESFILLHDKAQYIFTDARYSEGIKQDIPLLLLQKKLLILTKQFRRYGILMER